MNIVQIEKSKAVNVFNIKNERECHEKGIQLSNLAADQKNVKTVVGRWLGSNPSPPRPQWYNFTRGNGVPFISKYCRDK